MNSKTIRSAVAAYWRYTRQCALVAFEAPIAEWSGNIADLVVVNNRRQLIEIEIKVSMADLRHDRHKQKHTAFRLGHCAVTSYFYFAVPYEMANKVVMVCEQIYPYAGVLAYTNVSYIPLNPQDRVSIYREARLLNNSRLRWREIHHIVRAQSATVCRLAQRLCEDGRGEVTKDDPNLVYVL